MDGFNAAEYSLCESLLSEAITLYPKVILTHHYTILHVIHLTPILFSHILSYYILHYPIVIHYLILSCIISIPRVNLTSHSNFHSLFFSSFLLSYFSLSFLIPSSPPPFAFIPIFYISHYHFILYYIKVSDYSLNRGKARYYLSHFKEAQEDFRLVQKMVPLGMEVKSFIQQYSNDFQDFQDLELTKTTTNPKSTTKNERNSGHKKSKKIEEIVDFDSTTQSAFSVEGRNSLPKVRQNNYQNNYQNEKKIPQNILSSKLLKPLIKSDALKIRKTR